MKINRVDNTSFGMYRREKVRKIGNETIKTMEGIIGDKKITVYSSYTNNELKNKLYYLQDKFDNWLKFKLVAFENGKKSKTLMKESKI